MSFEDESKSFNLSPKSPTPTKYQKLKDSKLVKRDLESFPKELRQDALSRFDVIRKVSSKLTGGWSTANITPILDELFAEDKESQPSARTIIRWRKKYNDSNGDITSLVAQNHKMGNREIKVKGDEKFFDKALVQFLDAKRPSVARAYEYYRDSIIIENENIVSGGLPILSYDGFLKRIKNLPPYPVAVARHGKFIADQWFSFKDSHIPPTRVLERVEIDHTPLDLILLDDKLNIPLGRPYLTLLIDVFSGCVLGFHISYKAPSYVSVAKAIVHAIKPKDNLKALGFNLTNNWPCHGKIETLVVDNGAEFWSESLEQACYEAKINIQYNQVRKPWLKPFIERFFGVMNQLLVSYMPGKTFSNILEKEDYKPEKDAVMRFSTFMQEFHRWIVDIYHQDANSSKTRIPIQQWQQSVDSLPPLVMSDEEQAQLNIIMSITKRCKLSNRGIKFEHLIYDSTALSDYRKAYPQHKNAPKKLVKVNPDDLSKIFVYLEETEGYIEVPCTERSGYTNNLSLHTHRLTVRYTRERINERLDDLALAKARMAMHEAIKEEQEAFLNTSSKRKIKSTTKAARFADVSNTGNSTIRAENISKKSDSQPEGSTRLIDVLNSWTDDLEDF